MTLKLTQKNFRRTPGLSGLECRKASLDNGVSVLWERRGGPDHRVDYFFVEDGQGFTAPVVNTWAEMGALVAKFSS